MSDAPKRKLYIKPEIYRVELNAEQAILTACSLATTSAVNGGKVSCRPNFCKNHSNPNGGDSGPRMS
jgi:hypothetical protein